jgi:hypothetical protein
LLSVNAKPMTTDRVYHSCHRLHRPVEPSTCHSRPAGLPSQPTGPRRTAPRRTDRAARLAPPNARSTRTGKSFSGGRNSFYFFRPEKGSIMKTRIYLVAATAAAASLMWMAPAAATTVTSSTTCSNPFTGPQAGPSSFDLVVPATATVGTAVPVTVSFTFVNSSGYAISDLNSFSHAVATTGTGQNPLTLTAGSQGTVANGASVTVTERGTWTPDRAGTATFTLGTYRFNTAVFGVTVPVTCTFNATPGAVSSVVS